MTTDITSIQLQLQQLERDVSKLNNELIRKVSKEDADYLKIKSDLDEAKQKITRLEESLNTLKVGQEKIENKLGNIEKNVNESNINLAKLSTILDNLNSNIEKLSTKVEGLDKDNTLNSASRKFLGWTGKQIFGIILGIIVTAIVTYSFSTNAMQKQLNTAMNQKIIEMQDKK